MCKSGVCLGLLGCAAQPLERFALGSVICMEPGGRPGGLELDALLRTGLGLRAMHVLASTPEAARSILAALQAECFQEAQRGRIVWRASCASPGEGAAGLREHPGASALRQPFGRRASAPAGVALSEGPGSIAAAAHTLAGQAGAAKQTCPIWGRRGLRMALCRAHRCRRSGAAPRQPAWG